jgi:hypothetical protein
VGAKKVKLASRREPDLGRLRVRQPDLADSFRKAKAALDDASKDIAELRRRAGQLGRRSS